MKKKIPAGDFTQWLTQFRKSLKTNIGMNVPCGNCRACCTSSLFIHVHEKEKETMSRIPKKYLFEAPNLPDGNFILGYNSKGHCPLFDGKKCTIYNFRPLTCRMFDCRVFAAAEVFPETKTEITKRVTQWEFTYTNKNDSKKHEQIRSQAIVLRDKNTALSETEIALLSTKSTKMKALIMNSKKPQ